MNGGMPAVDALTLYLVCGKAKQSLLDDLNS